MPTFEFSDDHYRALTDLLLAIRDARAAFEAAEGKEREWISFSREIHRAQRGDAPLDVMIAEAQSWAAGWRRRASARYSRADEQTR